MASEMPAIIASRGQGVPDLPEGRRNFDDLALRSTEPFHLLRFDPAFPEAGVLWHDQGDPPHRKLLDLRKAKLAHPAGEAEGFHEERPGGRRILGVLELQQLPGDPRLVGKDLDRPDRADQATETALQRLGKELCVELGPTPRKPVLRGSFGYLRDVAKKLPEALVRLAVERLRFELLDIEIQLR